MGGQGRGRETRKGKEKGEEGGWAVSPPKHKNLTPSMSQPLFYLFHFRHFALQTSNCPFRTRPIQLFETSAM
jgi:hypothetical protein